MASRSKAGPGRAVADLSARGDGDDAAAEVTRPGSSSAAAVTALLREAPGRIDDFLAHVQRCLSTPAGVDTTLLFLCYSSRLAGAVLEALAGPPKGPGPGPGPGRRAGWLVAIAQSTLTPSATLLFASSSSSSSSSSFPALSPAAAAAVARLLAKRLQAFSAMLSEARTFLRLWGLLAVYFWARGLVLRLRAVSRSPTDTTTAADNDKDNDRPDRLETTITATQVVACAIFQGLENGAFLAQKGVLGWRPATIGRAYRWSARFWGAHVGIELGRLFFYESYRCRRGPRTASGEPPVGKEAVSVSAVVAEREEREEREWRRKWQESVIRQLAWFPLTIHWGLEQGLVSDMAVAALASIPGLLQIRDLWRRTAE